MADAAESQASHAPDPERTTRLARDLADALPLQGDPERNAQTHPPNTVKVILRWESDASREWLFDRPGEFVIGRSGSAQLRLEDIRVSGKHARLIITADECEVQDLKSVHGTRLNGERIEAAALKSGDILEVGRTRFVVHVSRPDSTAAGVRCRACGKDLPPGSTGDLCPYCTAANADRKPEVPGYEIGEKLGEGGFGRVYLAKDLPHGSRLVALKTVRIPAGIPAEERNRTTSITRREAQNAKILHHANIVECYDSGRAGEFLYMAMEYLSGGDLHDLIEKVGPLGWEVASRYMLDALAGMAEAHHKKIVHRDIKPKNLLLNDAGVVKVSDLGLAKDFERAGISGVTPSDMCSGSMPFMAPEQVKGFKYVDPTADVFSLGATFFYLLTKEFVRERPDPREPWPVWVAEAPIRQVSSRAPHVPASISGVVDRALLRDASARFEDAGVMRSALVAALEVARR